MAQQGSYPIGSRVLADADTLTGVVTGQTADVPLSQVPGYVAQKPMALAQVTSMNGGQLAGMRNRIINGSMRVDQRNNGSSQTIVAAAALAYCLDRWYAYATGANATMTQSVTGSRVRCQFIGALNNTGVGFGQRIEWANSADLAGGTATLSAKVSATGPATMAWAVYYANTTDTFGSLASPTRTLIASGSWALASTDTTMSAAIAVPSAATTGLEVVFSVAALAGGQTWNIGDAQLEVGPVTTPFEQRSLGAEIALCQRYFEQLPPTWQLQCYTTAGSSFGATVSWKVRKRGLPSLSGTLSYTNASGFATSGLSLDGVYMSAAATATGVCALTYSNATVTSEL